MAKQTVEIIIAKSTIYNEVNKHTSYAGAKVDMTLYDKVRVKSHDETMLERWWSDACGMVTTMFVPYVSAIKSDNTGFKLTLSLPSNWNSAQKTVLITSVKDITCDYLLGQWYQLLGMENQAKTAGEKMTASSTKVAMALYDRVRPTRPTYNFGHIGEQYVELQTTEDNGGIQQEG